MVGIVFVFLNIVKRSLATILFIVYTAVQAIGLSVNLHYCGNYLSDVTLYNTSQNCCGDAESEDKDCCEDHQLYLKVSTEHAVAQAHQAPKNNILLWLPHYTGNTANTITTNLSQYSPHLYADRGSPPKSQHNTWLLLCTLRL